MFLRAIKRHKDGKLHLYWTLVENVRVGRRVFQRRALYLGELNDSQRAEWQRAIEAFDEKGRARQLKLFPADRAPAEDGGGDIVKVRMDKLAVKNLRNWGEVWLGLELWKRLGLDEFWAPRLEPGRKGTDWLAILKSIVMYRLTAPGSELRMHSSWMAETAVAELLGTGALTGRDELICRLAVAKSKAGRAWSLIHITLPKEGEPVTPTTFTWNLDWPRIREARAKDEGTYLLRTNLTDSAPKTLWKKYMIQGEIEYAFRELKNDLGLRPVYHRLDDCILRGVHGIVPAGDATGHRPRPRSWPHSAPDHRQVQNPQDGGRHPADHRRPHHHPLPPHRAARRHRPPACPARPDRFLPNLPRKSRPPCLPTCTRSCGGDLRA